MLVSLYCVLLYSQSKRHNKKLAKRRGALPNLTERNYEQLFRVTAAKSQSKKGALMEELNFYYHNANITTKEGFCSRPK